MSLPTKWKLEINVFTNNPLRVRLADGETNQSVMKVTIKDMPLAKEIKA